MKVVIGGRHAPLAALQTCSTCLGCNVIVLAAKLPAKRMVRSSVFSRAFGSAANMFSWYPKELPCARRLAHSGRGKPVYYCTCTYMHLRVHVHLRLDGRKQRFSNTMLSYMLQALRILHARDVTSSTRAPTRGRDVVEFPSFQRSNVDGRKTIQIRSVWTRYFWKWRKRVSVFKSIRIRVDEA